VNKKRILLLAVLTAGCICLTSCLPLLLMTRDTDARTTSATEATTESGDAVDTVNSFMKALQEKDADAIEALSRYSVEDFFTDDYSSAAPEAIFKHMTYEITGDPVDEGNGKVSVSVSGEYPGLLAAVMFTMSDTPLVASLSKDNLYATEWGEFSETLMNEAYQGMFDAIADELSKDVVAMSPFEGSIILEKDDNTGEWVITEIPQTLLDVQIMTANLNPIDFIPDYDEASMAVLDLLIAEGKITQEQRDVFEKENGLGAYHIEDVEADSAAVAAAIDTQKTGWVDYVTGEPVLSYPSGTNRIDFLLYFQSMDYDGMPITINFYNGEGLPLLDGEGNINEDFLGVYYRGKNGSELASDTYQIVITMQDGTVIVDDSIVVN